jgi:hypothetical protein
MTTLRPVLAAALLLAAAVPFLPAGEPPALVPRDGWMPLLNGRDLTGWKGDPALWTVEDGVLIGRCEGLKKSSYLVSEASFSNFEMEFDVKLSGTNANSGVQYRSAVDPKKVDPVGYQADIGQVYWGSIYVTDERFGLLAGAKEEVWKKAVKPDDWNRYTIRAEGDRHVLAINGVTTVEAKDDKHKDGILALQLHVGAKMEVRFRAMRIRRLGK